MQLKFWRFVPNLFLQFHGFPTNFQSNPFSFEFQRVWTRTESYPNTLKRTHCCCLLPPCLVFWCFRIYLSFSDSKLFVFFFINPSLSIKYCSFCSLEIKIIRLYRSPRSQLHINLVRNYMLIIVTITSLVWFWLAHTDGKVFFYLKKKQQQNIELIEAIFSVQKCWETWIAQNIYRLIVIDFLFAIFLGSLFRSIRFFIFKFVWRGIGMSEFNISRGCLGLIFNQTLLWVGIFFSPPLAAIIILKMIATFYLKVIQRYVFRKARRNFSKLFSNFQFQKVVLINFCEPPSKLWRSSQTFTLFLAMMFVSLTIVIVISLYVLTQWV